MGTARLTPEKAGNSLLFLAELLAFYMRRDYYKNDFSSPALALLCFLALCYREGIEKIPDRCRSQGFGNQTKQNYSFI